VHGTIDDRYFEWLYGQVAAVKNRNPHRSYWALLKQMYVKIFDWKVRNDDNRVEDGKALRLDFIEEWGNAGISPDWMDLECSVLEMLIGLARRASFETGEEPVEWFWRFVENLDMRTYTDEVYSELVREEVNISLDRLIDREYEADGTGGLFPLRHPREDQRNVEIAYQLSEYLLERNLVGNDSLF